MINLFINAMTSALEGERRITVGTRFVPPNTIEVRVRDYGRGIGHDNQAKLFKTVYTTKKNGLGIGLSICSTIAKAAPRQSDTYQSSGSRRGIGPPTDA
jgi:two-component system sensor kinase FixL